MHEQWPPRELSPINPKGIGSRSRAHNRWIADINYRVRHLQHHRYLGTPSDTEFFGFDTRKPLTVGLLLRGMFDYARLAVVIRT
ncbi:hypothetical protein [Nocardia colli]|uniref:hypothetical protein n=1 Tax=Nocardia colli TaxID=2545717 RepID=UPI0035D86AA2